MASDVDQDNIDHQCLLKLYIKTSENPPEDLSDRYGIVRDLHETLTEKSEDFTKYITRELYKQGITLNNSKITCVENLFIQFHWYCDRGLDRKTLNLHHSSGLFQRILDSYINGLDIKGKTVGQNEQKLTLDIRIQCVSPERPESVPGTSKSSEVTAISTIETAKLVSEHAKPTEGTTKPTEGTAKPNEGATKPTKGTTNPTEVTTTSTEGTTKPKEGTVEYHGDSFEFLVSEHAKPTEGTTKPTEGTAKPNEGATKPTKGTTNPTEVTTTSTEGTTKPKEGTVEYHGDSFEFLVSEHAKPTEGTTKSTEGTAKPNEGATKPTKGTTNPTEVTTTSTEGTTKPKEGTVEYHGDSFEFFESEHAKPTEGTKKPTEGTAKPKEGTTKPKEGATKPTEVTTTPTEGTTKPKEGTTKPTEGTTKPKEGTVEYHGDSFEFLESEHETLEDENLEYFAESHEVNLRKKCVAVYLDLKDKYDVQMVELAHGNSRDRLYKVKGTHVWKRDISLPEQLHENFMFSIEVTYNVAGYFKASNDKKINSIFLDQSGSQCVFIGLTNDFKTFGTDGVCEFVIDIINNVSPSNLPDALLQIETMTNQHDVKVINKEKSKKGDYGIVFDKYGTFQKCNQKSLIESVKEKIKKHSRNLIAFSYFLFVVLSEKQIISHNSLTMLDIPTAKSTIDSFRYIKKEEIPQAYIEPIVSVLKNICKIVHVKSASVLLLIDIVYGFASTDVLMKIIDECQNQYGSFPLYVKTDIFQWKNLLLIMNEENNAPLSRIAKQLDREMLVELLLFFISKINNQAVKQFESVLNSRNCEAVTKYGIRKELHYVLSTWESTAIFNFQPSKKFINESEKAILSCISKESVVSENEFQLLLKILADDNLFLPSNLQINLIENLSRSKTAYSENSLEILIAMLNYENLTASGPEIGQFILQWFRNGLETKTVQKYEKDDFKIISRTYLRLRDIIQTKYVREQDDVMCLLENSVFELINQFKFKAIAKVLHEVEDSEVQCILVAHITKLLRKGSFGHDANDFCENDELNVKKSETADVVIAIIETMNIPRDTSSETILFKVLEGSKFWKKVLNITGKKKGKIEEHELVILVKKAIRETFLKMKDKSISCKFLQYLEKNKTKVLEISSHMSTTDILIDELNICHEKLTQFEDDLIVIEQLMHFVVKNHVGILIPYRRHLYDYISQQRIKIDDGTLALLDLFQPSPYLKKIHNIADICRRIDLASTSCVFWNIVRQHLWKQPDMIDHIILQVHRFGLYRNEDVDQEELKTSIISSTERTFCSISNECMTQFKHLWSDYRHEMKQNISETSQVFKGIENMESEIKTAEVICNFELPHENRNSLIRFSRIHDYKMTVEQIKAVAKSFKFEETPNSEFKQTVTKFEKMMEGNFSNLTLKEITPVLDEIHNIMTIIRVNEDLSDILSAINDSSELLDFLRDVIDEDIRNLIDAVEEHSEQYVRESTVSNLIEVKRFFHPMLNDDLKVNIVELFKLLNQQHKDSGIHQIPEKIRVCRDHLHSLKALYRNVANRGEHTVELIAKIIDKGMFHFKLETRICEVVVHYQHEKKDFKYRDMDLHDLRSRALLIMNAEKKCETDQKVLTKEELNNFVQLVDNAFEIQAICLNLKQAGHFAFEFYETKCGKDEMFELKIRLQEQYDEWTTKIEAIRSKYYYMNFMFSDQLYELYKFLKGNTETSTKNETRAMAVLKFMGLSTDDSHSISMRYQSYPLPDPADDVDYTKVLDNIGLTLNYISQRDSMTAKIRKEIGDDRKAPFIEKVQSGKPYFAWLDESSSLVIKVLLALYYNTTNILPEANQVLFCNENTTFEEIDLLLRRCKESIRKQKTKDLFSIVNVELLKREVQITLHDRIRHLSNGDFLLCFICRGNDTHPFLDQFKHSLFKLSPISETKMDQCFKTHCKHVLVVTSDVPGAGKTELIQNKAINDKKRCKTIHISGPLNRLSIIEGLFQLELKSYHSLHIDIGTVSDPFELDLFLFQLIVLRYVSAGSTSYALPCAKIYIEIANSVENTLCDALSTVTAFQREHLKWKNYEDLKVSMEINSPIQVVCRYLKELDECLVDEKDFYFNGPNAVKPLKKSKCKDILLKKFNNSSDMSYTLVNVFVRVLADQLKKLSSSLYFQTSSVKAIIGKDQPMTVRSEVVKALVDISKLFTGRSVHTCRATKLSFMLNNGDKKLNVEEILAKRVSRMIRWDESNHLMILFHKDIQTISAIYRHLDQVPESIIQLVESQSTKKLTNFNLKETDELENLLIQLAREPDRYVSSELIDDLRKTYVLTPDNLLKMILISLRINTRIPVIVMGETGCGKTSLIQYLATMCGIELDIFSIHAGTSEDNIYSRISLASKKAFSNLNEGFWLFLDEINTCEHLGFLTSALCHRFCRDFQLAPNLTLLAACNPYRLRREDSIHTKGLQGKIKIDHISKLVYRVYPLPETMMDFVWDYGSLSQTDEQAYILKMVERLHFKNGITEMLKNLLVMSQSFVRGKGDNDYCVSLRDVDRCTKLITWIFDSFLGKKSFNLDIKTRQFHSIILSLAICYQSRFCEGSIREDYRKQIAALMHMSERDIEDVITNEQENILNKMEYLPEGTALNVALQENVFMLLICILSKIPIFLVGKPGCSKSLAIQLIRSNLRGKDSANDLFKDMPQLFCVSFQGSESSTSEGIIKVFEKAQKYQEYNDEKDVLSLVILDEIGLAEESRFNPLKVLHEILEPGQGKQLNIAVVGISNWALDAAKMNRAIHLSRPDMNLKDLQRTGRSIYKSMMTTIEKNKEFVMSVKSGNDNVYSNDIVQRLLDGIASGYQEYCSRAQKFPHFHGLRDFYSLTKYIGRNMESILSAGEKKMAEEILIGILRNFGGLPTEKENILEIFKEFIPCITSTPVPVMKLILENIQDKTSRHLMLIASGNAVISVLERELNVMKLPFDIIFGSNFKDDLNEDYNYRILSRIILCMEQGMVLILKDLDAIYGSLYDMLNQNYTVVGKKKNCRVALGHYSNPMCHVHDDFKCIVLVEEYNLDYSDPPFLNRFEKQHFQFTDLLESENMKSMVEELSQEMTSLCQIPNHSFIPEDVIPSYSLDLIVSLIVHSNQKVDEQHIKEYALERILWLLPPEVMIRAQESKFSQSEQYFVTKTIRKFMKLPIHGGICHFSQKIKHSVLESLRTNGSSDQFVECFVVYTYSSLHSTIEDHFGDIQVQKQKIASFKSEKEFTTTVEHFFESKSNVFILQCTAGSETQHMLLSKTIIEKVVRKYQQTGELNQSRKYVYVIFHLDRGCYVHLPVNFLSSWNLLYMDSIQKPRTPLDHFLKVDKLKIVKERMPLHKYITDSLFWVLSRIKFASGDDLSGSLLEFLLSSLNSCKYAIDTIEEMIVSWIERRTQSESSSTWCINVAKSPHDLILSGNLIGALENNIQDFIKAPLSKYIFKMIDLNILTPVIFEDEFTACRRESWKKCVLSTEHLNIKDIPEPSGPECYSCSSRFLNLRMPFSQVFSHTIENRKDEFLYIVRRRCIEKNIEVDEEIPRELFENEVNDSVEIICYDALTIDHYHSQNDDYIYDFSNLFSSQFLTTDEPNRIQVFKWALSNFINLPLYSSRKFENLVAILHATVWVYGTVIKAICIMALEPAASLDLTYPIPWRNEQKRPAETLVPGFQNKQNTENDSHSIKILDRKSFVTVICSSLLPTSTVLKHYEVSKWLLKVGQILQLAQSVYYESSALRCLKLCHEISEALFENKIPVENNIYQIADILKNPNVTIDSEEVCNIIFETLKKLHETNVDGKVLQNLFCSYIVRCLKTNSENVYPFQFCLEKIASDEVFDITLSYYGQILKYAVLLDADENPNIFLEMLSGEDVLNENVQFCKCLDDCLQNLDCRLDKNMYLPVLATDILEYIAFCEDLSIDELNQVDSASSKLLTYLSQAMNLAEKGMCGIYTLASVAYIRKFLKNAFIILKRRKYDCTDKGVLSQQMNAILCQRKDTGFVTLLSSEMLHLFLKIVEHVSGQENVEQILRKLDNTITVLQNIHWNTEVVEEMSVFNPLILHVETNALGEYQRHIKDILTDDTPLSELLDDTSSGSPITILCVLTKQFYMKKCFGQLTDDEKRTAKSILGIVEKSVLKKEFKDIIELVLGQKDFKHGIFNLSEATESPVPQMVSVMIHLATIIVMNNQENTAWHKQLFCPSSVKFELSADLPPLIQDVLKLIWYSCLTCSYAFGFADTKSLEELTSESTENIEEYLRKSLENSWTCLHDLLEINYFDICLLLHEFLFKSKDLFAGKAVYMNSLSEKLIHEHAVILEEIMANRMQVIHEAKTRFARKIGSDLEQCVLDERHCTSNVDFPKVALLLRLSHSSSKNMLLTEIHAGHKSRFRFLTTVVKNMPKLVLPKHLSSLIKWHYSVVTFGTYKFRKLDFRDMTVSSFLCAFNEDSQRNVLEKAFKEFASSWNEIRLALSNLKEVLNCQTESGKIELSLMHKNATMKECSIIDEDSIFVEVLKYLANIQNHFLKDSGDKITNVNSMLIHTISIQDVKCEHLISFKLDDDWIDYCQCETRYGLGLKMNFYLDMIEKDMEQDILSGKVFVEIPNPVMKIIFIDELFQNSIELLKEISRNYVQNILPEKIKTAIRLQTSRDISTVSQLLTHTGMTLSLLRKKGPGSGSVDISIRDYLHNLKHITGMSSSVIHSLFPGDIKISHAVNLYQWLEELNGDSILDTLEDEYRIELQDNAVQCLHMAKQYIDHLEKLDHPLKVFAHRCLSVTSNKIRHSQPLNEYLANKDLWWQDDLKYDEDKKNGNISVVANGVCKSLEELLSPLIMVENIYYTVQFLAETIKEAKQKEQPFFNMEQPKLEKQNLKKEHGKQVIRKMKKRL